MNDFPCRVATETSRHMLQQERGDLDDILERPARVDEAQEAIKDAQRLAQMLNDEELAPPLAAINANLEGAAYEMGKLEREHRVPPEALKALQCVLKACAQAERLLFNKAMGE